MGMIEDPDLLNHFASKLYTNAKECHDMAARTTAAAPVSAMAAAPTTTVAADDADDVTIWLKQLCWHARQS